MIILTVERRWPKADYTIGNFYVNGEKLCNTLEDTDRGLVSSMPTGIIQSKKVKGKTAIPKGTYKVILTYSQKFKGRAWIKKWGNRTPELLGVKGFTAIRIHPGTDSSSTDGCVLAGDNTIKGKLTNSQKRFNELMEIIVSRIDAGEECFIIIK